MQNSQSVKVLHVIAWMNPKMGGVSQAVRMIINGLKDLQVQNEVVSFDSEASPFIKTDPFTVHALGEGKGPWCYNAKLLPWLTANLQQYDVVIVHGLWLYHTYAVRKSIEKLRIKGKFDNNKIPGVPRLFVMPHGMLDPYFQRAKERKIKAIRNWLFWKFFEGSVVNMADGLLFTSEEECGLAAQTFTPYKPRRVEVVGLGVEEPPGYVSVMKDALIEKCPETKDKPYILFLGRVDYKKGVDLIIKAYASLKSTYLQGDMQSGLKSSFPNLVIAGPGLDDEYGKEMVRLAAEVDKVNPSIFFPGMLSGNAKWGAFYGCDAFILSSHQENFGIAVVEALACGKPVLISNKINIWREIKSGGAGIVGDDTISGTIAMFEGWLNLSGSEKAKMYLNTISTFTQNFSIKPSAKKLLDAIMQ